LLRSDALNLPLTPSPTIAPVAPAASGATESRIAASSSMSGSAAAPSKAVRMTRISDRYPLRILLAEDNLVNQKMMTMIARKLGYELVIAANGQLVLDALESEAAKGKAHEIECILMDASMDVMDGMECTRIIRAQQRPDRTRPFIVAQTANVTEEYRLMCLDAQMDYFIAKPISIEDLVTAIKTAYAAHHIHARGAAVGSGAAGDGGAAAGGGGPQA
jgi:CheY-like chemotaxis protein